MRVPKLGRSWKKLNKRLNKAKKDLAKLKKLMKPVNSLVSRLKRELYRRRCAPVIKKCMRAIDALNAGKKLLGPIQKIMDKVLNKTIQPLVNEILKKLPRPKLPNLSDIPSKMKKQLVAANKLNAFVRKHSRTVNQKKKVSSTMKRELQRWNF